MSRAISMDCRVEGRIWRVGNCHEHDNVSCARCHQYLGVRSMLKHGGRITP